MGKLTTECWSCEYNTIVRAVAMIDNRGYGNFCGQGDCIESLFNHCLLGNDCFYDIKGPNMQEWKRLTPQLRGRILRAVAIKRLSIGTRRIHYPQKIQTWEQLYVKLQMHDISLLDEWMKQRTPLPP